MTDLEKLVAAMNAGRVPEAILAFEFRVITDASGQFAVLHNLKDNNDPDERLDESGLRLLGAIFTKRAGHEQS